ncbi:hypothetical protein KAH49_02490, partial [Providencia rettgeri]
NNLFIGKDRFYTGSTIILSINPTNFKFNEKNYTLIVTNRSGKNNIVKADKINNLYDDYIIGFTSKFRPNDIAKIIYLDQNDQKIILLSR